MNSDLRITCDQSAGFTLVENVMAIAVVASTVLPLIGLLALSTETQRNSEFRDQAVVIVRQIDGDLRSSTGETGPLVRETGLSADNEDGAWPYAGELGSLLRAGLAGERAFFLSYGEDLQPLRKIDSSIYGKGTPAEDGLSLHLFRLRFFPSRRVLTETELLDGEIDAGSVLSYLVTIEVSTPAAAPLRNREVERFSTRFVPTNQVRLE
jgi:type II secretory pathway pseudopilin PulG